MSEVRKQQHKFSSKKDDKAAQRRNVNVQVTSSFLIVQRKLQIRDFLKIHHQNLKKLTIKT